MVLKYFLYLICQLGINLWQAFREVFVYGTFRDSKFLGYCPHRLSRLDDIPAYLDSSLFDVIVHTTRLPNSVMVIGTVY